MASLMSLNEVSHVYGSRDEVVHALKNVTLNIENGEKIAIVGHSGSGKSTLANILCCLLTPSSGTYRINGNNTCLLTKKEMAEIRSEYFGIIFQNYCLVKRLSVFENVMFPMLYDGKISKKEMREMTEKTLREIGIEHLANKKPNQISGGQQQMTAIARAVVKNPRVIIADEPTANLDVDNEKRVLDCLNMLNEKGATLITITHNPAIAEQYPRILRITNGTVTEERRANE